MGQRNIFSVLVASENPSEVMAKYDKHLQVEKYIKYRYSDVQKIKECNINVLDSLLSQKDLNEFSKDYLDERRNQLKTISKLDFYTEITEGLEIDEDGNAWSTENPNGQYDTCNIGKNLCVPFVLKDNTTALTCRKCEIDWDMMHLHDTNIYDLTWDLFHGEKDIVTPQEKQIYENMKNYTNYFENFKNKDEYTMYNSSYWHAAFVDDEKWVDMSNSHQTSYEWITTFFDRFIIPLDENTKLTVYECTK